MEEEVKEVKNEKGWGSGVLVGLVIGVALFMLTYQLLLMAK
jgi:tetrahydromethanopterin S-methyltransferase subunit G